MRDRAALVRSGRWLLFLRQWPSNWEPSPFEVGGIRYGCVEQYMMAEKARTFGDERALSAIMSSSDPSEHQRIGRAVVGYDDRTWSEIRYGVVLTGQVEKYRQNEHLMTLLSRTDGVLSFAEASRDPVWGTGFPASHPDAGNEGLWTGRNLLGRAVTKAREILCGPIRPYPPPPSLEGEAGKLPVVVELRHDPAFAVAVRASDPVQDSEDSDSGDPVLPESDLDMRMVR